MKYFGEMFKCDYKVTSLSLTLDEGAVDFIVLAKAVL